MSSRTLALALAFAAPLVAYVLTSGAHSYWLDSGEFVAAAVRLDIAHPPGHPLTQIYGKLWTFLPLGPLSFRVTLGQGVATALACCFLCRTLLTMLRPLGLDARVVSSLALSGAWLAAFGYGLWFQAVRAEVYALQTLCMSVVIERVSALQAAQAEHAQRGAHAQDMRPLYVAALALGLGLANHHLIAVLLAPALLPCVWICARTAGLRPLLRACGFGVLALCTYAYLPVRALARPAVNLGDPRNLENFAWVLSARVYSKNLDMLAGGSLQKRASDMLVLLAESFSPLWLLAALLGSYLALRLRPLRDQALLLLLVFGLGAGFRGYMGSVLGNPDVLGYLGPALLCLAGLVVLGAGALAWLLRERGPRVTAALPWAAACLPLLACLSIPATVARASLARFSATDVFDDARVRSLPPRAVMLTGMAQTTFRHFESDAEEQLRPDVTLVPLAFLRYPGTADTLLRRAPHVAPIVNGYLLGAALRPSDLLAFARQRPVFVELDAHVDPQSYRILAPSHLVHHVLTRPDEIPTRAALAAAQRTRGIVLQRQLGADATELETSRQRLWMHYLDALFFASLGARDLSRHSLQAALAIAPSDDELRALAATLRDPAVRGPVDVRPFLRSGLVGAGRAR